jgi:dephospho-CoA kinase
MAARTLVVGLTGGIGTGKSRVVELLARLGAAIVDSDRIVRELQQPGSPALARIAETFGPEYLLPDGNLDRAKLGKLVFDHPAERARLNAIMLPAVTVRLRERLEELRAARERVVVLDIPLLLEGRKSGTGAGAVLPFDVVVVVYADEETQVRRVMERDRLSREDALARVRAQLSIEEKRRMADVVIDNRGDWDSTEKRVRELFADWTRGAPAS